MGRTGWMIIPSLVVCAQAQAQCPVSVGDVADVMTGEELAAIVAGVPRSPDTFETTEDFQQRRMAALQPLLQGPVFALSVGDEAFPEGDATTIRYDANNQRVLYNDYFFSNSVDVSEEALRDNGLIDRYSESLIGFNIQFDEMILREYDAGNALGASITVTEVQWDILAVAQISPSRERSYDPVFITDLTGQLRDFSGDAMRDDEVMAFGMPIEFARESFFDIRPVIVFELCEPYILFDEGYIPPVRAYPIERNISASVLMAEILCGLIVSSDGTILDVANVDPSNAP